MKYQTTVLLLTKNKQVVTLKGINNDEYKLAKLKTEVEQTLEVNGYHRIFNNISNFKGNN